MSNKKFCGPCYFAHLLTLSPSPPTMHITMFQDFVNIHTLDNKTSYEAHNATVPPWKLSQNQILAVSIFLKLPQFILSYILLSDWKTKFSTAPHKNAQIIRTHSLIFGWICLTQIPCGFMSSQCALLVPHVLIVLVYNLL
jgi:hypothetical protein